jgi:ribose transport system substrate-binding protein
MVIAMQKMEAVFKAYPEINLVIGVAGEVGPAAAKVVSEMGLRDKITIIGIMAQNFYKMGNYGVELLVDYLRDGKKPDQYLNDSGSIFVTMDNFDVYQEALKE